MPAANRRRHANAVPLLSLCTWIVLAAAACAAGLFYVYCKNQLHTSGQDIKKLETELARLDTDCQVAKTKIASLSSRMELQRKLASGIIKLQPITDDRLVRVGLTSAEADLRPVVNERVVP